jgi:pilus assembly protein CpaB
MKKRSAVVILIAGIAIALLAGIATFTWLQKKTATQTQAVQTEPVVVAAVDLSWGTVLDAQQVRTVPFLKGSLPGGFFPQSVPAPAGPLGRTLLYPVKQGEPILESRLTPTSLKIGGVSAVISEKKRAVAVKVDKVIGVSGFINPGNRVDVLVTTNKGETAVTKIVLENMLVLATGTQMEKTGTQEKATPVDVITMEVTPEEAEKLALAASEGKIQLALRNPADTAEVLTRGATVPTLLSSFSGGAPRQVSARVATPKPAPQVAAKPVVAPVVAAPAVVEQPKPVFSVQAIRGTAVTEYKFEKGE